MSMKRDSKTRWSKQVKRGRAEIFKLERDVTELEEIIVLETE